MKRWVVLGGLITTLLGASTPTHVQAGAATDAALGLGAFAVFSQLFGWGWYHPYYPPYYQRVIVAPSPYYVSPAGVYASAPTMYASPPVVYAPAPPPIQREVVYAHGRYVLIGDGMTRAYEWVWVPNPPAPPPAPPTPPASP